MTQEKHRQKPNPEEAIYSSNTLESHRLNLEAQNYLP